MLHHGFDSSPVKSPPLPGPLETKLPQSEGSRSCDTRVISGRPRSQGGRDDAALGGSRRAVV